MSYLFENGSIAESSYLFSEGPSLAMRKASGRNDFDKSFMHIITLHSSIMKAKFYLEVLFISC